MKIKVDCETLESLADTVTPVTVYLRVRDRFPGSLLLECGDYRGTENSLSYICVNPISSIRVEGGRIIEEPLTGDAISHKVAAREEVVSALEEFVYSFEFENSEVSNGVFGYTSYPAVQYFEEIEFRERENKIEIPELFYSLYEYLIVIDHFRSSMKLIRNRVEGERNSCLTLEELHTLITSSPIATYPFSCEEQHPEISEEDHREIIRRCKSHIFRGDVFQIVPSRRFTQRFEGDEFNVYRTLRSINPSPFLFFFDYRTFRILGSSPEAQLVVKNGEANIYPIAGTYPRLGGLTDSELADKLSKDPKESSEHVMLVDLARNDLSRHCRDVHVKVFKEVQFFSHVVHLVSRVTGTLRDPGAVVRVFADTFPAGTLTGAPKFKAMELIDRFEKDERAFYGGAVGMFTSKGECVHAIMIRSMLSKDGVLYQQAGGGIVADSSEDDEVREVLGKVGAPKRAVELAGGRA